MEKIIPFRMKIVTEEVVVVPQSNTLLLLSARRTRGISHVLEEIDRSSELRKKIGPSPLERVWKNAAAHPNFKTHTRAINQLFEYQHAFWREIRTLIDSRAQIC